MFYCLDLFIPYKSMLKIIDNIKIISVIKNKIFTDSIS
ncbi:hypothetical protein [Escherichia coli ISC41]|nr:hypothetical protein ECDEC2C_4326 [Escherichia coli DEC2C]CDL44750.1 hypothetical protein [Escherichia coli ISC41]